MIRLGIDVGGTFTDIVIFNEEEEVLEIMKSPTTLRKPVIGIIRGLERAKLNIGEVGIIVHASTIGSNLFLGQIGLETPKAVLITNRGFRDILEIGRQNRPSLYNLNYDKPRPLIPRNRRIGVKGRIGPKGEVLEELDRGEIISIIKEWCEKGIKVFIVSFLHSYINNSHEIEVRNIIREECHDAIVVLSSEVDPQPMEYERTSTAVVNAILKPVLSKYLDDLYKELEKRKFSGILLVMQSNGGVASVKEAVQKPATFIESGPSAGAVATAYLSRLMGIEKALGFDMGGTTAKASSIVNGEPEIVEEYEVGGKVHMGRMIRGSGYPVRFPHIDLAEVSAGGGTIAWIDPGGGLRIGPLSAGADPGPACYGKGGRDPTVTDANLLLGRLPEELSGGLRLNMKLAENAIREKIARPLNTSIIEASWMIKRLADEVMGRALRLVSIEKGYDPREFSLFAFGGAGPLHAVELAGELGIPEIIIPPKAGVFSALGLLVADFRHSLHKSIIRSAGEVDVEFLNKIFEELEEKANTILEKEGVPPAKRRLLRFVEARYWGQGYTLRIPYRESISTLAEEFHEMHKTRYGFSSPGERVDLVLARLEAVGLTDKPLLGKRPRNVGSKLKGEREVFFHDGWHLTPIYDWDELSPSDLINGPAVVEAIDTTVIVPPGFRGIVDEYGSIIIRGG